MISISFSKINKERGSILIAIIGMLAVLSIMAITFSVEMQTSIYKANEIPKRSDVRNIAESGFNFALSQILKNGEGYDIGTQSHGQLKIEQEMEMSDLTSGDLYGVGYSELLPVFNTSRLFNNGGGAKDDVKQPYISELININSATIRYSIEDVSGKLPVGHVKEYFQRHLLSNLIYFYLHGNSISDGKGDINQGELFDSSEAFLASKLDILGLRSICPLPRIKDRESNGVSSVAYDGIPFYDGLFHSEELAIGHNWSTKGDDKIRSANVTRSLMDALTPFARWGVTNSSAGQSTTYASINPQVMAIQNQGLYKALFNYVSDDSIQKLQFCVSFPPVAPGVTVDDMTDYTSDRAIAQADFFSSKMNNEFLTQAASGSTGSDNVNFVYNARGDINDKRSIAGYKDGKGGTVTLTAANTRTWEYDFTNTAALTSAHATAAGKDKLFYSTMKASLAKVEENMNALNSVSKRFMSPVVNRQALEYVILKSVFFESLILVDDVYILDSTKKTDGLVPENIYASIESGELSANLGRVYYVHNALSDLTEYANHNDFGSAKKLSEEHFVPYWNDPGLSGTGAYSNVNNQASILYPMLGVTLQGGNLVNYLPHPETNQRGLHQVFPSVEALYSSKIDVTDIDAAMAPDVAPTASAIAPGPVANRILDLYDGTPETQLHWQRTSNSEFIYVDSADGSIKDDTEAFSGVKVAVYKDPGGADSRHYKPADFSPYETKIRMAVLVNLLNAIIPPKIADSPNTTSNDNDTMFSTAKAGNNNTLKDFIYFVNGEYKINHSGSGNKYMDGWEGGVQTPGMTFWKYGVHSTTFKVIVDAAKEEESARLTNVVTFDYLETPDGPVAGGEQGFNINAFAGTIGDTANFDGLTYMHVFPENRFGNEGENIGVGIGKLRYPTPNTSGWQIISSMWGGVHMISTESKLGSYWVPIIMYATEVANVGGMGPSDMSNGAWHYVNHPGNSSPFVEFYVENANKSVGQLSYSKNSYTGGKDVSLGSMNLREYTCGAGSWVCWKRVPNMDMASGTLELQLDYCRGGSGAFNVSVIIAEGERNVIKDTLTFDLSASSGSSSKVKTLTKNINFDLKGDKRYFIFLKYNNDDPKTTIQRLMIVKK